MQPTLVSSIPSVIAQHLEDAVVLHTVRNNLLRAPHVKLQQLARLDERLRAHLDGLAVAGPDGVALCTAALASPGAGEVFTATVRAIEDQRVEALNNLLALVEAVPETRSSLLAAFGWVSAAVLRGVTQPLLTSPHPLRRAVGIDACAMHRVDPGAALQQATEDADPLLRARAWRAAGKLGRIDLADAALHAARGKPLQKWVDEHATLVDRAAHRLAPLAAVDPAAAELEAQRAAAWALTLWGQGQAAEVRAALMAPPAGPGLPPQLLPPAEAHRMAALAAPLDWGRSQVRTLSSMAEANPAIKRRTLRMAGWVGDVQVLPWLIQHMADPRWARLAAEAFSLITGADLAALDLEGPAPEGAEAGPNDNPEDANVALEEDHSLPWPDAAKVQAWWLAHASRYTAGQRYFLGEAPSATHAQQMLQTASQRQRAVAAEWLCLLQPGSALFNTAAPAWRQLRM